MQEPDGGEWCVVLSPSTSADTRVLRCDPCSPRTRASRVLTRSTVFFCAAAHSVHPATGALSPYRGVRGWDAFSSEAEALDALAAALPVRATQRAAAVLGLAPLPAAGVAMLLLATRVRTAVVLPGGHDVFAVTEATWVKIPLRADAAASLAPPPLPPKPSAMQPPEAMADAATVLAAVQVAAAVSAEPAAPGVTASALPPAPAPGASPAGAAAMVAALLEYPVEGAHFYCETADVGRPFAWGGAAGAGAASASRGGEFVWNAWLAAPFAAAACAACVPALVQGSAECRVLSDAAGARFVLALLARRSAAHPGTRYLARGLNAAAAPGNEVETEQLLWRLDAAAPPDAAALPPGEPDAPPLQHWASCVWRRGTVPIRWGAEIKSTVGEAELYVAARDPYAGTADYFSRIASLYTPPESAEAEGVSSSEGGVAITCVNLLRSGLRAPELLLTEHFHEGARRVRRALPSLPLRVLNFDWHAAVKGLGDAAAVEGLWAQLAAACAAAGVTRGVSAAGGVGAGGPARHEVLSWQRGVVRYNCADSLDRTNLASFFGAAQLLVEQCRRLGLVLEAPPGEGDAAAQSSPVPQSLWATPRNGGATGADTEPAIAPTPPPAAAAGPLPPGWESRRDAVTGNVFFIDHNTRTTTWTRPPPPAAAAATPATPAAPPRAPPARAAAEQQESFGAFGRSVESLRASLLPGSAAALAELFAASGDLHAALYTGSRALHSSMMALLDAGGAARRGRGHSPAAAAASQIGISVQRRFTNLTLDAARQAAFHAFLGRVPGEDEAEDVDGAPPRSERLYAHR